MERKKNIYLYFILSTLLFSLNMQGQNSTSYNTTWKSYENEEIDVSKIEIQHKPAKWYDLRDKANSLDNDTFDKELKWFENGNKKQIQATHTLVDTIYAHKNTKESVWLHLPDRGSPYSVQQKSIVSIRSYQRWYDYETDGLLQDKDGNDLLIPDFPFNDKKNHPYRMKNGYVGYPMTEDIYEYPSDYDKDASRKSFVNMEFQFQNSEKDEYKIACDVSSYTDFTLNYHNDKDEGLYSSDSTFIRKQQGGTYVCYEPTLSHRIIYVIRNIDNEKDWRYKAFTAQKNTPNGNDFLEEHEISMPTIRYKDYSEEMIALTSDAKSYVVPGTGDSFKTGLDVSIDENDNTAGIKLWTQDGKGTEKVQLSNENRVIKFTYPKRFQFGDNTPYGDLVWTVDNANSVVPPTATIKVTKTVNGTTYRIAKFKLTFTNATTLLSQSVIKQLEDKDPSIQNTPWQSYEFRTNKYLSENYELLTELNFDYDPGTSTKYGQEEYYPFPMSWSSSSYAFYDGSPDEPQDKEKKRDFIIGSDKNAKYPEFGYYGITSGYITGKATSSLINSKGKESSYHMYIDASDRPGTIARLEFDKQLCKGSELFVTAWVKTDKKFTGPNTNDPKDNGAMLFTIMGVTQKDDETEVFTPIYRHQTGQIPSTYPDKGTPEGAGNLPGFGNNEWLQLYFSFVNKSSGGNMNFDRYILQVDNNSPSTSGSDIYLDDIRVYVTAPRAQILQKSYGCTGEAPLLRMRLGWDRLLSRSGVQESAGTETDKAKDEHISFCFVDSLKYHEAWNKNATEEEKKKAFTDAIVSLSYPMKDNTISTTVSYGKLLYSTDFDANNKYDTNINAINKQEELSHIGEDGNPKASTRLFRMEDTGVERSLAADIYAQLEPFRTYYLVLESPHETDLEEGPEPDPTRFKDFYLNENDNCVAKTTFQIESQGTIMINGELSKPDTKYCAGEVLNFGVQLRADLDGKGYKPVEGEVFYDWFLGAKDAYNENEEDNKKETGVNVGSALAAFRSLYPGVTELDDWKPENDQDKKMKVLLQGKVEAKTLVLNRSHLSFHLPEKGLQMMVRVIPKSVSVTKDIEGKICADPIEIDLKTENKSPQASIGFNNVTYPDVETEPDLSYRPVVRIGKGQIGNIIKESYLLKLPLRNVVINTAGNELKKNSQPYVYLIASNDPKLQSVFHREEGFKNTDWPVGTIDAFQATTDGGENNYLTLHFGKPNELTDEAIPKIDFREGFWYTLEANFVETNVAKETNNCDGNLVFDLKVVPEYQKWIGTANDNWNNDKNWKRSSAEELHKTTDKDNYNEGYTNPDSIFGYVPMSFTNVTIPENRQIQLYEATENTSETNGITHSILNLAPTDKPSSITDAATQYIEYDLMVKNAETNSNNVAYDCKTYYTNTVDQIHFEPSAEMLHAEYLTYNKAWVDYKLNGGQWYTLASPLQSVVAGDWYTKNTGSEDAEYFTKINFTTSGNNRFQPSVYQRGWKKEANMITIGSGKANDKPTVAITGNWSGVYNDVAVPYTPGEGFSVKVLNLPNAANGSTLFRFPKADTKYSYYSSDTNSAGTAVQVRTDDEKNVGKLKSDELKPKNPTFTVTLGENTASPDPNYHLIGNPFMAHLNAKKFFEANTNLQQKFWLVTKDNQSVAVGSSDGWITTGLMNAETESPTIAPLQSFFVEKATGNSTNNAVTFNADMQALGSTDTESKSSSVSFVSSVSSPVLTLTATTADGHRSRAAIAYDPAASDEYKANEDAELFLDSNLGNIPAVYTVAGTMAASINRTPVLWNIPVGIYGNSNENVTLSFDNLDLFPGTTLYDAEKKTETALHNGYTLTVPANTCGRYFLRAGTPTGNEKIGTETIRIYTVARRQLIVTATENLQTVSIYDFAGHLLRHFDNLASCVLTTYLDKGNYIVKATGKYRQETCKIQIR